MPRMKALVTSLSAKTRILERVLVSMASNETSARLAIPPTIADTK